MKLKHKQRILVLAATTGYQTRAFAEAAGQMGLDLVLGTDRCHVLDDPWGDRAIPLRFEDPEASAATLAAAVGQVDGIVALADRPTLIAALVAERLGLPYNSAAAVEASRNKFLARERFRAAGLPVPDYFRVPLAEGPEEAARRAPYPCVLKPLGLSASRGVIRANAPHEFTAAFHRIAALLGRPEIAQHGETQDCFVQVESFIPGREFAIEGLVTDGRLQVLAIFDKPDPLDGPFFEETVYVTPSREPASAQAQMVDAVTRAVAALGLTRGPLHAELRFNDHGAWMLEVAARPIGGLCAKALRFGGGVTLEEVVLRHALGQDVSALALEAGASGVMMVPIPRAGIYEDVDGVEEAKAMSGIEDVIITAKRGQELEPLPEGGSYLGFIFARAESPGTVEAAIRAAHATLRFRLGTALPVVGRRAHE